MIENHISGNLYNENFSESSEEKFTVFQSVVWSLIVYKTFWTTCFCKEKRNALIWFICVLNLIYFVLEWSGLSLCILYFLCKKGTDTSEVLQHLSYFTYFCTSSVNPIFCRFYKCFNNFDLSKNLVTNKFFH